MARRKTLIIHHLQECWEHSYHNVTGKHLEKTVDELARYLRRAKYEIVRTIPTSGQLARCAVMTVPMNIIDGIPLVTTIFGTVSGLPDEQPNTMYIVSLLVKQTVKRFDVVSPGEMVRDGKGNIVGCKNFNV